MKMINEWGKKESPSFFINFLFLLNDEIGYGSFPLD